MNTIDELEQQIQKQNLALNELAINIASLNRQADELFKELNVRPEQISAFLTCENHFTPQDWEALQKKKREIEEQMQRALNNIKDPRKTKKTLSDRHTPQHWLFVR